MGIKTAVVLLLKNNKHKKMSGSYSDFIKSLLLPVVLLCLFIQPQMVFTQETKGLKPVKAASPATTGITRAVVVGISDYQNKNITDLQYADRDAMLFADFLRSRDGMGLDSNHVTLLLNSQATAGRFISALYGILEESKEGDQVIVYFSGHGDVESTTISQPGFLLCWDAPSKVYMSGGTFGLAYLQEIISTLSLQSKAKVLVITDACHSGKLAGSSIGGAGATASNLSKQFANELKILSCQPDEFSLEGQSWGNGRGVFSYYLIPGLAGLADKNNDNTVSLLEIERYLEDNVSRSVSPHSQIPMTVGQKSATVTLVSDAGKKKALSALENTGLKPSNDRAGEEFVWLQDSILQKKYAAFNEALKTNHLLYPAEGSAWALYQELKEAPALDRHMGLMRRNLAASLQDEAQQAINKYLAADSEELNRRWLLDTTYKRYPEALEKAVSLLGPGHFYYKALTARSYYFKGLLKRLEGEGSDNMDLLRSAVVWQDSCLVYDSTAAFCYNERGYLKDKLDMFEESVSDYKMALAYSPNWPLVWSNLCAGYQENGKTTLAIEAGQKALDIDSTFSLAYLNLGNALLKNGEQEKARNYFVKGYNLDKNSAQLNAKLGVLAYRDKNYGEAQNYWLQSLELMPDEVQVIINLGHNSLATGDTAAAKKYFFRAKELRPNNVEAHQGIIEYYYYTHDYDNANHRLKEYVIQYPNDGMAHFLISSIEAGKGQLTEALMFLDKAFANGFKDLNMVESDNNLKDLVKSKEYTDLKARYFR